MLLLAFVWQAAAWSPNNEREHGWKGRPGGYGSPKPHDSDFEPDHVLRLSYQDVSVGCQVRTSVLVNGTLPGPTLRLRPGETSWIRVYNDIQTMNATMVSRPGSQTHSQADTTQHWHGLSQRTAIFSDGTPSASQWPIPPLHFFDYEVFLAVSLQCEALLTIEPFYFVGPSRKRRCWDILLSLSCRIPNGVGHQKLGREMTWTDHPYRFMQHCFRTPHH